MAAPPPQQVRHLLISGRVQGVGFRWFTRERARRRGLHGWVQNRPDGTVEILVRGSAQVLDDFLSDLRRGPQGSDVQSIADLPIGVVETEALPFPFQIHKQANP